MVILNSRKRVKDYERQYPESELGLEVWSEYVAKAVWSSLDDVLSGIWPASLSANRVIFDIPDDFEIVTKIVFAPPTRITLYVKDFRCK